MKNVENCAYWERTPAYILSIFLLKKHINYFKLGVNEHVIITFPWLFQNFYDLSFLHDFSRPGNDRYKIPWLFQVFQDRTNPVHCTLSMLWLNNDNERRVANNAPGARRANCSSSAARRSRWWCRSPSQKRSCCRSSESDPRPEPGYAWIPSPTLKKQIFQGVSGNFPVNSTMIFWTFIYLLTIQMRLRNR